jgi:multiple sugar transport system substrate-binding protein
MLLIVMLLTSCIGPFALGAKSTVESTSSAGATAVQLTPTPTIKVDASSLRGVNITFMYPWTGDVQKTVESMVADFNSTNEWGIRVITSAPGSASALTDSVAAAMQNLTPPEVIAAPIDYLLRLNQEAKVVADLTPYVDSPKYGMTADEISYFSDTFWQQDMVDGYRYGIPAQRTAKVLVYNKTWANEMGFADAPATPDDFKNQICEATGRLKSDATTANDGMGGWLIDYEGLTMASWMEAFGSDLGSGGKFTFDNYNTIAALKYLRGLQETNCAWFGSKPAPYEYFAKRQTLVYTADLEEMFLQQQAQKMAGSTDEWVVLPFPSESSPFILAQGPSYAVLAQTDEKKLAAWLFVRWMSNVDHQGKIVKASGTLPLGEKSIQYAVELEDTLPQWAQVAKMVNLVKVPPSVTDWNNACMIMEDASWQLFKTNMAMDKIPDLVKTMDDTLAEISVENK